MHVDSESCAETLVETPSVDEPLTVTDTAAVIPEDIHVVNAGGEDASYLNEADAEDEDEVESEPIKEDTEDKDESRPMEECAGEEEESFPIPDGMDRALTLQALHALLFVSDRPLSAARLAEVLGDADTEIVTTLMGELMEQLAGMPLPYSVRYIAGGYQLLVRPDFAAHIRRLLLIKKSGRLSKSALETLAIVAYKQPCTRAQVEDIRGVSVSHAFDLLLEKRLIKVVGVAELPGRPKLFRTTDEFLIHFGLGSLKELPSIQELRETM